MRFNDLLIHAQLELGTVAIMLHMPAAAHHKRLLLALVDDAPELFEVYQDNHPQSPESTLKSRRFVASFVADERSECRFVGLYAIDGWVYRTAAELDSDPKRRDVVKLFGNSSYSVLTSKAGQSGRAIFKLCLLSGLADLRGRLIVPRPPGRSYMRLAENCDLPILSVERTARFSPPPPDWTNFIVSAQEIRCMPRDWQARLQEWRGVYLVVDQSDGARYVGSAYGAENPLGRWKAHVAGDMGVTVELSKRQPDNFRFSILQLSAPTAPSEEVLAVEANWKERLETRKWGLNNN